MNRNELENQPFYGSEEGDNSSEQQRNKAEGADS